MGGFTLVTRGLVLMVIASMLAVSTMAKKGTSKNIIVGGSNKWSFGFNYTDWAIKNGPFYVGDTLVFKFNPPPSNPHPHSVYLLPDHDSFLKCDLSKAKMQANVTDGVKDGFHYVLKKSEPHFFACGESKGIHCNLGHMKFFVLPISHGGN